MERFIRFFVERHLLVNVVTVVIAVTGVMSLLRMPMEGFPAFDLPPLTEMIDEEVGGLCEMSEDSLAEAMLSMLSSGELIAQGAVGRRRGLEQFTFEGNADAVLAVYERAIGDSGRRGNS